MFWIFLWHTTIEQVLHVIHVQANTEQLEFLFAGYHSNLGLQKQRLILSL